MRSLIRESSDDASSTPSPSIFGDPGFFDKDAAPRRNSGVQSLIRRPSSYSKSARDALESLLELPFTERKLYGREQQILKLRMVYNRVARAPAGCRPEIIAISGASGSGKSALARRIRNELGVKSKFNLLWGKFDMQNHQEPYSALITAFSRVLQYFADATDSVATHESDPDIELPQEEVDAVVASLKQSIGTEGKLLTDLIPTLGRILDPQDEAFEGLLESKNKLLVLFRKLTKTLCSQMSMMVLFLDDLQWADPSSLDVLASLATDNTNSHLLILSTIRNDDPRTNALFSTWVEKIRSFNVSIEDIKVCELDVGTVNLFLSDLLKAEPDRTQALSSTIHRKTNGNVFFIIEFVKSLRERGILDYDLASTGWSWEVASVDAMDVTENVRNLLSDRMRSLHSTSQFALKVAACLGGTFPMALLMVAVMALKHEADQESVEEELNSCIKTLTEKGILEIVQMDSLRFAHDQILQSATEMMPDDTRRRWKMTIGEAILDAPDSTQLSDQSLFSTVDLCNEGLHLTHSNAFKRRRSLRLNMRAGRKAMAAAGFPSASKYLTIAIGLLSDDCWQSDYRSTVDLYSDAAECEYCNGNFEQMQNYLDQVLGRNIAFEDKVKPYLTLITSMNVRQMFPQAFEICLLVLNQLNVGKFPRKATNVTILMELMKTKAAVKRRGIENLSSLELMDNQNRLYAARILDLLATITYLSYPKYIALLPFRHVQWCIKYGIGELSPLAFVTYGLILCGKLFQLREGYEHGKVALAILRRVGSRKCAARVTFLVHGFVYHWSQPVHTLLRPSLMAHQVGMDTGDIESAMFNLQSYCIFSLYCGKELMGLESEMKKHCSLMEEYGQSNCRAITGIFWQQTLNLMGEAEDPLALTGEAMDEEELLRISTETANFGVVSQIYDTKMHLAYLFGSYGTLEALLEKSKGLEEHMLASAMVPRHVFYRGMAYFALASVSRKKARWTKKGLKIAKRVEKWVKGGNVNCIHMVDLFAAEKHALKGRRMEARVCYERAIAVSSRNGFLQDRALAHERASLNFMALHDEFWASYHLERSHRCYMTWGASQKANQLVDKYGDLCVHDHSTSMSSDFSNVLRSDDSNEDQGEKRIF